MSTAFLPLLKAVTYTIDRHLQYLDPSTTDIIICNDVRLSHTISAFQPMSLPLLDPITLMIATAILTLSLWIILHDHIPRRNHRPRPTAVPPTRAHPIKPATHRNKTTQTKPKHSFPFRPHRCYADLVITHGPIRTGETECIICRDVLEPSDITYTHLGCRHSFHSACFDDWVKHSKRRNCVYCQRALVVSDECRR